jgi:hypothetical protein
MQQQNQWTASINVFTASLYYTNQFTASLNGTNQFTASLVGTNAFTASLKAVPLVSSSIQIENYNKFATTGSNTFSGSQTLTGSVSGIVKTLTIGSGLTASIDFNAGTFFQIDLPAGPQTTHITGTNVKPGLTVNLLVVQNAVTSSLTFNQQLFKFQSGSTYNVTQIANAKDIVSFVTFNDTSSVYTLSAQNLL